MEKTLIVEFVKDCKLVRGGSEENGHDCWGNLEFNYYKFIYLNGKEQRLEDHWWVIHDGKEILEFRIPALPPDIEYQERAIDFAYGWSTSTSQPSAMQEYAQQSTKQERDRAIQECIEVAERELDDTDDHAGYVACNNIVKKLKEKLKSRQ